MKERQRVVGDHDVAELLDHVLERRECSPSESAAVQSQSSTTL